MTTVFGGYNHRLSCQDGEWSHMENMTADYYPYLSPREKRANLDNIIGANWRPQTLFDCDGILGRFEGNRAVIGNEPSEAFYNSIEEMEVGLQGIRMGNKIIYPTLGKSLNIENGSVSEIVDQYPFYTVTSIGLADESGNFITSTKEENYDFNNAQDGDYVVFKENGKEVLKQWKEAEGLWKKIKSPYTAFGVDYNSFDKFVGTEVKVCINNSDGALDDLIDNTWELDNTVEEYPREGYSDKWYSKVTILQKAIDNPDYDGNFPKYYGFCIDGMIDKVITDISGIEVSGETISLIIPRLYIDPLNPKLAYATECNNRLWGCSEDGHEIYASALGEWKVWKQYKGVSTDSYAATIGSGGEFTGAITYNGNPIFFKEHSMVKITVSSTGAHQVREIACEGIQKGSAKSACVVNGVLYYKGIEGIYAYDGSLPVLISSNLGDKRFFNASAGRLLDKYYVSMCDGDNQYSMFVYDTQKGIWTREDNTEAVLFCTCGEDLYYIRMNGEVAELKSVRGSIPYTGVTEEDIDWCTESGNIGYYMPNKKHLAKLQLRLSMELGTNVCIYLQYDSSGNWEHICNLSGTGTRSFMIPVIPRRCDHFKYKIAGRGGCKIFSITKTIEEGSDL